MSYLRRQVVMAALTANAVRPVPGYWAGVPAMIGGWLTSELAPHLLSVTLADTVHELLRGGRNLFDLGRLLSRPVHGYRDERPWRDRRSVLQSRIKRSAAQPGNHRRSRLSRRPQRLHRTRYL